jgi:NAD(P)-dependent dehydrogenase (short-subunit alcohol dehydrogenase family)
MTVDTLLERSVVGSFSRFGYRWRSRDWDTPLPRLDGQTAVVSGATSGIGLEAARRFAALGARTVIIGRNQDKLTSSLDSIKQETGGDVVGMRADLSSIRAVNELADRLLASEPRLNILVNNASVLPQAKTTTSEGLELTVATNLVGPFLLTNRLIPRMIESAPARIITVSSGGMYTVPLHIESLEVDADDFSGATMYANTKRAQVALTEMWADQLEGTGVVVHSMHPGWVDTAGLKASLPKFHTITRPFLRSVSEGADTIVFLGAADEPSRSSGRFWHDRASRSTHRSNKTRSGPVQRDELWDYLCRVSGDQGTLARPCPEIA